MKTAMKLSLAGLAVLLIYLVWPQDEVEVVSVLADQTSPTAGALALSKGAINWPPPSPYGDTEPKRVPLLPIKQDVPAAQSMAMSRNGDERTPPIVRNEYKGEQPSAAELADPKLYAQYETRQNLQVYASFIQATNQEIPRLKADIERGRAMGIPAEKIAKAEDKVRRMEAMQLQLMKEHPQLAVH